MVTVAELSREEETARFEFGENWKVYVRLLDDARIGDAEESLRDALGELSGRSFLDIGSGSGLFSLAARRLGAQVTSFDYDPSSVWCTEKLRGRYRPGDDGWRVTQGSATDTGFMRSLGYFDVVYSWGVLHHTGRMWDALDLALERVTPGGLVFISLYNDQGRPSRYWRTVKRSYNTLPSSLRPALLALVLTRWIPSIACGDLVNHSNPLRRYLGYAGSHRGMSSWRDWVDWVGGYPFEVARPGDVFTFLREHGFQMLDMRTSADWGCNEYLARRSG